MKNNFHKKDRKAFTIVELVIVIAVIAILAAVLIPTFANIIKKSNLSADKQAVREMNQALAEWKAAHGYDRSTLHYRDESGTIGTLDVDSVMVILGRAGLNTDNWQCLTQGYQVYWFAGNDLYDTNMVLVNNKGDIEYPEEYAGKGLKLKYPELFEPYNNNHVQAISADLSLGSVTVDKKDVTTDLRSVQSFSDKTVSLIAESEAKNLAAMQLSVSNTDGKVSSSLANITGKKAGEGFVFSATKNIVSSTTASAYCSLQVASVGTESNPVILKSDGTPKENYYYLSVVVEEGASENEIETARKDAGAKIAAIFTQITEEMLDDEIVLELAPGTVVDCSGREWPANKTGNDLYFGTSSDAPEDRIVIMNARLSDATSYERTYHFPGDSSGYFLTGYFGSLSGNAVVENITFTNLTISQPATDYKNLKFGADLVAAGKGNNRNTVGIIGGILDGYDADTNTYNSGKECTVTVRNVTVDGTCRIIGDGCCGGLVGYIGSGNTSGNGKAPTVTVNIENCVVSATVESKDTSSSTGYRKAGGLVGFLCRSNSFDITIKDCTFNGKVDGFGSACAAIGDAMYAKKLTFAGTNHFENATVNENGTAIAAQVAAVAYSSTSLNKPVVTGTVNSKSGLAPWSFKGTKTNLDGSAWSN